MKIITITFLFPDASIQLQLGGDGATASSGRVEVLFDGVWGTICDDDFGLQDADVICRQLGFNRAVDIAGEGNSFGPGGESSPIYFDDLACDGTEESLIYCQFPGLKITNCQHSEDVAVTCLSGK